MLSLLGNKRFVTTLLYRGSEDGWKYKDFHLRCDNKGPTISLFKVKNGDCIGAFTKANWSSESKYFDDSDAMLFNLSCCRHSPSKSAGKDILCGEGNGPYFGINELSAFNEPLNGVGKCYSMANKGCYGIPLEVGKNMLTNQKDGSFTISVMEVWEITGYME